MGVSLGYQSSAPVQDEVRETIRSQAEDLADTREWWAEPIMFFDMPEYPKHLVGDTKLFCAGCEDVDADSFMGWRDGMFILEKLAEWSREAGIEWQISMSGESIGVVTSAGPSDGLREFFDILAIESGHEVHDPARVESEASVILAQNSAR